MINTELNTDILKLWDDNTKILKLWDDTSEDIKSKQWPVLFPPFEGGTILFIGLNPSGEKKAKYNLNEQKDLRDPQKIKEMIKLEEESIKTYPYFRPFRKIVKELGLNNFDHLDLYFYRKYKGAEFKDLIDEQKSKEFAEKQLSLSLKFLKSINPRIVFVANCHASYIINNEFEIDKTKFETNGFDFISLGNSKIPIFFSGMISSARSIDSYSLRRLNWHLRKAMGVEKHNGRN